MIKHVLPVYLLASMAAWVAAARAEPFEFQDGDRVVLIGSTMIERDQRYGLLETLLTSRYPERNLTFRNLGWSGDTVFGDARAGFDTPAHGFQRLNDLVHAEKPTVLLVGYGANEAFEGEAGLPRFRDGLNTLLDTLADTQARTVLLTPPPLENLGAPLPDPAAQNANLAAYSDVIRQVAAERQLRVIDLNKAMAQRLADSKQPLTDNGMHFTEHGYWHFARAVKDELGLPVQASSVALQADGSRVQAENATVGEISAAPSALSFQVQRDSLPAPSIAGVPESKDALTVRVDGLSPGRYALHSDGTAVTAALDSAEWSRGVAVTAGPDVEQMAALREAISLKNRLYFHRWRPQNETYLFGFRKHEQGKNAAEVAEFDPLVAEQEQVIAQLRKPQPHKYQLVEAPRE